MHNNSLSMSGRVVSSDVVNYSKCKYRLYIITEFDNWGRLRV